MLKARIKTQMDIEKFRALQQKVEQLVVEKQRLEVDYDDMPDEFKGINIYLFIYLFFFIIKMLSIFMPNTLFLEKNLSQ